MATAKLRIFLPSTAPVHEIVIKAAEWDTFSITANENLEVKLGAEIVCVYSRGQYIGAVRQDVVWSPP